jgi:hypothetical protein
MLTSGSLTRGGAPPAPPSRRVIGRTLHGQGCHAVDLAPASLQRAETHAKTFYRPHASGICWPDYNYVDDDITQILGRLRYMRRGCNGQRNGNGRMGLDGVTSTPSTGKLALSSAVPEILHTRSTPQRGAPLAVSCLRRTTTTSYSPTAFQPGGLGRMRYTVAQRQESRTGRDRAATAARQACTLCKGVILRHFGDFAGIPGILRDLR